MEEYNDEEKNEFLSNYFEICLFFASYYLAEKNPNKSIKEAHNYLKKNLIDCKEL